jgi:hypothetical protein
MPSSTSSGGSLAMREPRGRRPLGRAALAITMALLVGGLAASWAPVALAVPGPGSECDAEAAPSGESDSCPDGTGFDLGFLLPLGGAVVLVGAVVLGGAYLALRRRAAVPLMAEPADAAEWWACRNCGRNNVVGSARCYACGAWQR